MFSALEKNYLYSVLSVVTSQLLLCCVIEKWEFDEGFCCYNVSVGTNETLPSFNAVQVFSKMSDFLSKLFSVQITAFHLYCCMS